MNHPFPLVTGVHGEHRDENPFAHFGSKKTAFISVPSVPSSVACGGKRRKIK
jgi:hypothetical protein